MTERTTIAASLPDKQLIELNRLSLVLSHCGIRSSATIMARMREIEKLPHATAK